MGHPAGARHGKRHAIRDALGRLGMHVSPAEVVRELARWGIRVSEELVRAVRTELLSEDTLFQRRQAPCQGQVQPGSYRPQKKPPRRG